MKLNELLDELINQPNDFELQIICNKQAIRDNMIKQLNKLNKPSLKIEIKGAYIISVSNYILRTYTFIEYKLCVKILAEGEMLI